jgi:hypothetical protein
VDEHGRALYGNPFDPPEAPVIDAVRPFNSEPLALVSILSTLQQAGTGAVKHHWGELPDDGGLPLPALQAEVLISNDLVAILVAR